MYFVITKQTLYHGAVCSLDALLLFANKERIERYALCHLVKFLSFTAHLARGLALLLAAWGKLHLVLVAHQQGIGRHHG